MTTELKTIAAQLDALRIMRDRYAIGSELRALFNAVCDRMDVLHSALNEAENVLQYRPVVKEQKNPDSLKNRLHDFLMAPGFDSPKKVMMKACDMIADEIERRIPERCDIKSEVELKQRAGHAFEFSHNLMVVPLHEAIEAIKAEREACAKVCEEEVTRQAGYGGQFEGYGQMKTQRDGKECASAIRLRSKNA